MMIKGLLKLARAATGPSLIGIVAKAQKTLFVTTCKPPNQSPNQKKRKV
jgi:hypothetical protein